MDPLDRLTPLYREPTDGVTHWTHHPCFVFLYRTRVVAAGEGEILIFVGIWSTRLIRQARIWLDTRGSRIRSLWCYRMIYLLSHSRYPIYSHMDTERSGGW